MKMEPLPLPQTVNLIASCWTEAEASARRQVLLKYPDADEEFITRLFFGELRFVLAKANRVQKVQKAFVYDLCAAASEYYALSSLDFDFDTFAEGIVAEATPHSRRVEQ